MRVEVVGGQEPIDRREAEGADLEDALAEEVADEGFDSQMRVLSSGFEDGLDVSRGESAAGALVFARLGLEGWEVALFPAVVPALEGGRGVEFAVPLSLAGHACCAGQREVLADCILDETDSGVTSQCQILGFGFVVGCIFHIAMVFVVLIGREFWDRRLVVERQWCVGAGSKPAARWGLTKDSEVNSLAG
ncbi:hypothetical protein [Thermogutta sp.]|uniref:hypothetical protein n=1 Tax=Thermogutta sp. TaxID=1962930 RepID=UPI00321F93D7